MLTSGNVLATASNTPIWGLVRLFWPVFAVSFGVSLVATPICRRIALKYKIIDRPDDFLKPHQKPIPYLGGVAIFLGWAAGIAIIAVPTATGLWDAVSIRTRVMIGVAVAGTATMLIGLFDDLRVMRSIVKLGTNIVVAVFLLWLGLGTELVHVATDFTGVRFGPNEQWLELIYSLPVMLLIVVGACNATNLIDGLDGLCTGVLGIISIGFVILATHLRLYNDAPVASERIILALAMLGAAAGFLPFNRNPAKIFMGDAGSMLLGLNAAVIMLLFAEDRTIRWMMGALMVFGLPISDMFLAMARRWRNGRPVMEGDRSHFYDQLVDRGLSVRRVVAISYLLTLVFGLVGISVIFLRTRYAILVYFVMVLAVFGAVWKFNMASIEPNRQNLHSPANAQDETGRD